MRLWQRVLLVAICLVILPASVFAQASITAL
jgi:hypothetical protein